MSATLRQVGNAVESPERVWHVNRDAVVTFCGLDCSKWPSRPDAAERFGVWCRACLARGSACYRAAVAEEDTGT